MKDTKEIKATMDKIRTSIKAEADILKSLVDTVTSDKIEQINKMEEAYIEKLQSQDATCKDYVSYLEDLVKEFHGYLSSTKLQNNTLIFSLVDRLNIRPIPETTKPVPPVFTAGQYSKEDVAKLLGRVTVPDTKPENREIKSTETASTHLKPTEKMKQEGEKSDVKKTLSLSFFVTKVREYTVLGVPNLTHLSQDKSGRFWGSDYRGTLVQIDFLGNQLHKIQTNGGYGYHTVTQYGDLIYKGNKKKVINRRTPKNAVTELIKTGDWTPISIHSSRINGDILVGMRKDEEANVIRYNKTGKEIQNIQRDNKGQKVYGDPHYITENINGDICTSDYDKQAVVVVNKSGQHRFSYKGQGSWFIPWGICTDLLGHILVCTTPVNVFYGIGNRDTVYLLDQDGQFLSLLLTEQQGINNLRGLSVDDENNLHVGQKDTNTVTVYKYLQ
uniref:Tripartite motif-containing protein 2 n=1 Tax=Magallana gigas TaxID=29159 RepID=K1QU00_MAGGI